MRETLIWSKALATRREIGRRQRTGTRMPPDLATWTEATRTASFGDLGARPCRLGPWARFQADRFDQRGRSSFQPAEDRLALGVAAVDRLQSAWVELAVGGGRRFRPLAVCFGRRRAGAGVRTRRRRRDRDSDDGDERRPRRPAITAGGAARAAHAGRRFARRLGLAARWGGGGSARARRLAGGSAAGSGGAAGALGGLLGRRSARRAPPSPSARTCSTLEPVRAAMSS